MLIVLARHNQTSAHGAHHCCPIDVEQPPNVSGGTRAEHQSLKKSARFCCVRREVWRNCGDNKHAVVRSIAYCDPSTKRPQAMQESPAPATGESYPVRLGNAAIKKLVELQVGRVGVSGIQFISPPLDVFKSVRDLNSPS